MGTSVSLNSKKSPKLNYIEFRCNRHETPAGDQENVCEIGFKSKVPNGRKREEGRPKP
ncbi:hypothetical protein BOSEA31B_14978 [Hyphomicrobiales bacterium]|nr:hypothetical protein BOSEA31B_14978 [Hyphomicrobiales bacterium]CAH1701464.1 hypothetical protein BOSEA1005_21163 [Hyphomicrobiales bacterium]CAI0345421.1 hypothetical protein BO1005MUT1_390093 [Hyphomicrobiales bacterium]